MNSDYEFVPDEYEFEPDEYELDELENQDGNQDGDQNREEQDGEEQDGKEQDSEEQDSEEQDDEETTNISDSRKTAEVWKYFDIRTEHHSDHPVCKSCGQVFSQKTGNSSLKRHLKSHQIFISKKNLQQTTINFQTIIPHSSIKQEARDHAIVIWIIVNQQPFAIIENKYFRSMISKFDPKYKFPNRATIKKMIMELYENSREKIKQDLEKIPGKVSLTSDMWTSTHT